VEDRDVALKVAEAELWARKVAHDPDLATDLLTDRADPPDVLGLLIRGAVGEVEPEDVDAGREELAQDIRRAARGPDRGDDLGAAGDMRGCATRRNPFWV
jgi:hypothetical protein